MEDQILPKLFETSAAYGLLGFVIFKIVALLEKSNGTLLEMTKTMAEANAVLADAVKGFEAARLEEQRAHQEQTILAKMTLDRVSELSNHG